MISKTICDFDWDKAFLGKNVDEKTSILTKTILNIMSNTAQKISFPVF